MSKNLWKNYYFKLLIQPIVGFAVVLFGTAIRPVYFEQGDLLQFIGLLYAMLSGIAVTIILAIKFTPYLYKTIKLKLERNSAHKSLLKYKNLHNQGILTQEEYDRKATALKNKIL
ncbi:MULTISPECIES: SHOCT domain-containing protein [unclassified Pseudoalteromonas]|jgi:hypothetical protein|uniref:SHOCT domain-containing protein n=1 Tax=unclassified Pseudoalteromonas TaxID=194690 RepID=UPI0004A2FBA4|nr:MULTISPECIES: SHOCT domain-containing protein [unclassified Pseudoalteromonas]MDC9498033.1 SHOCT domain-containing protein [Pseudoalteromonas sp. Angola-20]MDC9517722.1 SHOCT domain-containing protein [Pseudoalteromonas sp. Angola-22]MDC9534129.1 SHOCT domain-containing protein [Pseudoalteromonas sp. Angola-9]TMP80010.1 cell division protein FtsW [Pseudoalteromonas sp. S983]